MKNIRKIMAVLLSVMMLLGMSVAFAAEGGRVTITYAQWGNAEETAAVEAIAAQFNESQDRITVEIMPIPWETYMAELNTMATANELPDTAIMSEQGVLQWASQGMLGDVSQMYAGAESAPLDSLAFRYEGNPVAYSTANEILLLYYNRDMFDAAGIPYPPASADSAWTWDEFVEVAKQLTLDANGLHPDDEGFDANNIVQYGAMVENLTWQLEVWALSNGGGFYSEDGSEVIIQNPEAIEAIQRVADLNLVHHVAPLSAGMTDDGVQRSLLTGTVAMTTNGAWNVGTALGPAQQAGDINYGVGVLPYMKEKVTINTGGPNVMFNTTEHPAEAMEWLSWYAKEENAWANFAAGTWMPTLEAWYTNEEMTHRWVDNPNFPPYDEYKSAVVDYAREYARPTAWYYVNNTVDFNNLLGAVLGEVWNGNQTAEQAITENIDALIMAKEGM